MKTILSTLLIFFLLQVSCAQFKITEDSATISFQFKSKDVKGTISGFNSSSNIDFENPSNSIIKGSVKAETIKTGNSIRDWSLRRGKYFNADDYPKITFESTSVHKENEQYIVKGNLTLKGITKTITWIFTISNKKLTGTTTLFSSDFKIDIKNDRKDNKVNIKLTANLE